VKILLVEDNPHVVALYSNIISTYGYEFRSAANGAEGMDAINESKPDVIITDLVMPVMDGWHFIELVKESAHFSDIPIIVASIKDDDQSVAKAMQSGADKFISKSQPAREVLIEAIHIVTDKKTKSAKA
jgi:CheY-like chemotaxis protein